MTNNHEHTPNYRDGWPEMPVNDFQSDGTWDLGYIEGLYLVAEDSIRGYYGTGETLDPNNIKNVDFSLFKFWEIESVKSYLIGWGFFSFLIPIIGIGWCCCCVCCCCCCRRGFMGKPPVGPANANAGGPVQPQGKFGQVASKNEKIIRIALIAIQCLWLFLFFLIMIYSFGGPVATNNAIHDIQKHLDNGIQDADKFLEICQQQMNFMYLTGLETFKKAIDMVNDDCEDPMPPPTSLTCANVRAKSYKGWDESYESFNTTVAGFVDKLQVIRNTIRDTREAIDGKFEEYIVGVNKYLFIFLIFSNVFLLAIFLCVSVGLGLAVFGRSTNLKLAGHLTIRGGFVGMFILPPFFYIQIVVIFIFGGLLTQKICPKMILVDNPGPSMGQGAAYTYNDIMGHCKDDQSAYNAFNLKEVNDVTGHNEKVEGFEKAFKQLGTIPSPGPRNPNSRKLDPVQTIDEIMYQANHYVNEFLVPAVKEEGGKCRVGYNAIYSIVSLLCIQIPGPLLGYWYLLQFIPALFVLIIVTEMIFGYFERLSVFKPSMYRNNPMNMNMNMPNAPIQPMMNYGPTTDKAIPATTVTVTPTDDTNANVTKPEKQ